MSENTIPPEILEAATVRYMLNQGHSEKAVKLCRQDNDAAWQNNQRLLRLILEAAGVPALLVELDAARILLDEQRQANDRMRALKTLITTRIAELERELEIARKGGSE